MQKLVLGLIVLLGFSQTSFSQLPDGSIAPNFTLTDRDGVEHHLYEYLDQGKVVFIKFFACHCPGCWAYHETGKLDSLYAMYGPDGTDQIRVLMLEHDQNNPEAFSGQGSYTQGDWETGNSVPMIDVEGAIDRQVFDDYNLNYYPMVMKICTDKRTELMSTSYSIQELFNEADDCPGNLSLDESAQATWIYLNDVSQQIELYGFQEVSKIQLFNLMGQEVLSMDESLADKIDVSHLKSGVFIARIQYAGGFYQKKISL